MNRLRFSWLPAPALARAGSALLLLALSSATGLAQKDDHPYLRLDAGVNFLTSTEWRPSQGLGFRTLDLEFDPGLRLDLAGGLLLRNGGLLTYKQNVVNFDLLVEMDLGITYNSGTKVENIDLNDLGGTIDLYQFPFMANLLFRGPLFSDRLQLAIGVGVGGVVSLMDASAGHASDTETDLVFGYQALARLDYALTPAVSAGLGYRFMGTVDADYGGDIQIHTEGTSNHAVTLAITWTF